MKEYLSKRERAGTFSGVVLVGRNGDVELLEAYGYASKRHGVPNQADTKFDIGSINKMFTGVAVLQLGERGLIDLDTSISKYVDDFSDDVGSRVTIRHLLRHRSGWGSYFDKEQYRNNWPWLRTVSDYIEFVPQIPLDLEPGTSRQSSSVGYVVLGAVIEAVTGQDYYQSVAENIFRPTGMEYTDSYEVDRPVPNLAQGYVTDTPEKPFNRLNTFMRSAKGTPAGGGYSTVEDLLRFDKALRNNQLLSLECTNLFFRGSEAESSGGVLDGGAGYAAAYRASMPFSRWTFRLA